MTESGYGQRNAQFADEHTRFITGTSYHDLSTIMVVPSISLKRVVRPRPVDGRLGALAQTIHNWTSRVGARCPEIASPGIPEAVAFSWLQLQTPANAKFSRMSIVNCEVGDAYNQAVQLILDDPGLSQFAYMLTVESDNVPPHDGLLKLLHEAEEGHWDALGGAYWQKGEGGGFHAYGQPQPGIFPKDYRPWVPKPNSVSEVNALGMGFTLFKIDMFKYIKPPWFKTVADWIPGVGELASTQDLYFFKKAARAGYRFAVSTNVRVGHIDGNGVVW